MSWRVFFVVGSTILVTSTATAYGFLRLLRRFLNRSYPLCWFCKQPLPDSQEDKAFWEQMAAPGPVTIHAPRVTDG